MPTLTTWEAERNGFFQGTATPGQIVGRFIDWGLANIGKLPKVPEREPNKDHWTTWPDGKPIEVSDKWIDDMIREGRLPNREQVTYSGAYEQKAQARAMMGSHVIVELLDTDRKTRHRCILLGNVLIATGEGWKASLRAT